MTIKESAGYRYLKTNGVPEQARTEIGVEGNTLIIRASLELQPNEQLNLILTPPGEICGLEFGMRPVTMRLVFAGLASA